MSELKIEYRQKCDYCGMTEIELDNVQENPFGVRRLVAFGMSNFVVLGKLTICRYHEYELLIEGKSFKTGENNSG